MITIAEKSKCSGCTACRMTCPVSCIEMLADDEGFDYPQVDDARCTDCGACTQTCPIINVSGTSAPAAVYACHSKDEEIRLQSSSGGIFTILAQNILTNNGVVFGARFNDRFEVVHDYVESVDDLHRFRGSKYVQSRMGDCFEIAKRFLDDGREVLFSGTPCQIAGLKAFLQKDYSNLLAVDIICHGAPSPKVFKRYMTELEQQRKAPIRRYGFRDKPMGWRNFRIGITSGSREDTYKMGEDLFMRGFLVNLFLRPSCHDCSFKAFGAGSDIMLGDYWGVEKVHPEIFDDKGTSLVMLQTEKGARIFQAIMPDLVVLESTLENAVKGNSAINKSVKPHVSRNNFFADLEHARFDALVERYTTVSLKSRIKRLLLAAIGQKGLALLKKTVRR